MGTDRDLDAEKPDRKPTLKDPGDKVTLGPFIGKSRVILSSVQMLVRARFQDPCS